MKTILDTMLDSVYEANDQLTNAYADKLHVNYDLDRTLVSFQANKRENGHRWCKYKEGFSAALMRYIFDRLELESGKLLDPFVGSGTALFAASDYGLDAAGIELLPHCAEIIKARSILRTVPPESMAASLREFAVKKSWKKPGKKKSFAHLRITKGAFSPESELAIERYLAEIQTQDTNVRLVLQFAVMCILESISYTRKDGQYLRWDSRSGRRVGKRPFCKGPILAFDEAISAKIEQIALDISGKCRQPSLFTNSEPKNTGAVDLRTGSCLDILPSLPENSFDAVVTSPPYCNRYDYTRTYALELAMIGVGEEKLKSLRQTMLSCTVENREKQGLGKKLDTKLWEEIMRTVDDQKVLSRVTRYLDRCREEKVLNNNGIPRMVHNYFKELALVIFECGRVLKPGSPFVMVNDNVRYQGAHIPVDLILSDFAKSAGFEIEAIWVLPRGKGNSSQQMGIHGREEVRKCVYVWRFKGRPTKQPSRKVVPVRLDSQHVLAGQI
ncbi:MAG: site-specific DNA-methyltransferase [Phycisphaerae bacterium]|nr:site-specific DNA-methyltransferase [Phycisphaerae bacterium]